MLWRLIRRLWIARHMPTDKDRVTSIKFGVTVEITSRSTDPDGGRALLAHLVEGKRTEIARSLAVERIVRQRLAGCDIDVTACVEKAWARGETEPPPDEP